jgi:DNA-binding SARP family transcriptional activator
VRKALGEECIISHQKTYTLNPTLLSRSQVSYDVAAFEDEHALAKQALAQEDDKAARGALEAIIDLYRGDYVQPFYSDWCIFRRERLRITYLDARHHLAQLAWRCEAFEESASHFQHVLVVDPSREEAHYGLMRCYLRQGKRTLALRQYQRCRETLQQELNVEPGPALQKLYQHLRGSSAR